MARLRWFEVPFGESPSHHIDGCTGHCNGKCSATMDRAWHGLERQAPVSSESFDAEPTVVIPRESMAALMARVDTKGVPSAAELDAELSQHAGAGQ